MATIRTVRLSPGREPHAGVLAPSPPPQADAPLVSCLMVTRGNRFPARLAIDCYRRQTYPNRELVIVCDRPNSAVAALVRAIDDPAIRYVEVAPATLGELRNTSVAHARGELLCQWDDDDLSHADRVAMQVAALIDQDVAAVFLHRWLIWWPARRALALSAERIWEGTMVARRDALPVYPAQALGEDNVTVQRLRNTRPVLLIDQPYAYCYVVHGTNSYGTLHFEQMLGRASRIAGDAHYDTDLARLSSAFPIRAYSEGLDARRGKA